MFTPRRATAQGQRHGFHTSLIRHAQNVRAQFLQALFVLVALVLIGVLGYMLIEEWSAWDAFYMTMITITTVGYGEVRPLTREGEVFTVLILIGGVSAALYTLNAVVRLTMEGELSGALGERAMHRRIEALAGHIILCGYGRVGEEVARSLIQRHEPFVVIDKDNIVLARAESGGCDHVHGDSTEDNVLLSAGIARARCLIAALDSDASNSWVVLSARALNPDLWIVARADHPESETKLKHAGANRILSPPSIGGLHMALSAVQPHGQDLIVEQVPLREGSALSGLALGEALAGFKGCSVLAVRRHDGELIASPTGALVLHAQDELILLGPPAALQQIIARAQTPIVQRSR